MKKLIIEGNKICDIDTFYQEVNRVFMKNVDWKLGQSLDAFNDLLYGNFGEINGNEEIILIWNDFKKTQAALGFEITKAYYQEKLKPGSPFNKTIFTQKLMELENGTGQTYFDIILEIVAEHTNIILVEK